MTIISSPPTTPANVVPPVDESSWDDFTQLTGIGKATQKQLHEVLGIHTFMDLSCLSPNELIHRFRQLDRAISITQAASWIDQAQACVSDKAPQMTIKTSTQKPSIQQVKTIISPVESMTEADKSALMQWWVEVYDISHDARDERITDDAEEMESAETSPYQTVVRHRQTGDILACWPGVAMDSVHHWLQEQWQRYQAAHHIDHQLPPLVNTDEEVPQGTDQKLLANSNTSPLASPHGTVHTPSLRQTSLMPIITQVSFHQPLRHPSYPAIGIATPNRPMRQVLKRMEPFALTIQFQCPALETLNASKPLHYSVEVYAHHRESSSVRCLGRLSQALARPTIAPETSGQTYSTVVTNAYLPKSGLYRLKILVKLAGIHITPGYFEIPMIQAV